jgi:hypothetical protein
MKIDINIIPDEEKRERAIEKKVGLILRISFSFIFALAVLSGGLFAAQYFLSINYSAAKADSQSQRQNSDKESEQTESFLASVSTLSQKIAKTSDETPRWSKIFVSLSQITPADITLTAVHAEKEHIKISGFSKTREAFLEFQKKIEESEFKNLKSPESNFVSQKDFIFEIEADIDKDFLNHS